MGLLWLAAAPLLAQQAAQGTRFANDQCIKCHSDSSIASMHPQALAGMVRLPADQAPVFRSPDDMAELYVNELAFNASVHAGLACTDCHTGITRLPHDQRLPVLRCGDCHADAERDISTGMHRAAADPTGRHLPTCTDCHGPAHEIPAEQEPRAFQQTRAHVLACIQCHGPDDDAEDYGQSYLENVHGRGLMETGLASSATCMDCHGAHKVLHSSDPESPIHPLNAPETCGRCHEGIAEVYADSIHGQHLTDIDAPAASCTTCHHSHGISSVNNEFTVAVVSECSNCHADLAASYRDSFHGKATMLGHPDTAVCSSCHGAHDIRPAVDPASRVHPDNLVETCSECHDNVNRKFVQYISHAEIRNREANPQVYWTWLIMTTLLLSVLAVFVPHGLLWLQRSMIDRIKNPLGYHKPPRGTRYVRRFNRVHRFTHFLIVISFMGLVITGFPLKYSYADWAQGMAGFLGGSHILGLLHRLFAIITFAYAGIHAVFLAWFFAVKCPRPRWKYLVGPDSLVFSWRDLKDFWAMVRWFFWLGPRPRFDRWTYYEKFDYFGEIWGVFLIGGTGLILWFPMLFTRWLPGWVLNCAMVIHSIEALLAASVIFLVHFFNTHLRPEKFPIDMVMLTGSMTETEMEEERPAEYERLKATGRLEEHLVEPLPLHLRIIGAVFGMLAFFTGIVLIVLALSTELTHVLGK